MDNVLESKKVLPYVAVATTAFVSFLTVFASGASAAECDVEGGLSAGLECTKPEGAEGTLFGEGGIFQTITNTLLFIVGAVSVIMLIIGGIRYVISAGDQNAVQGAKNTILYAIVGIVVAFLAYAAVNFVISQLEG